jgi:pantetheine-phosphate adenylyltransferase
MKKFKKVAVGGTFDQLHRGHKALLGMAFEVGGKVIIGLSSDIFVAKMGKPHKTASYAERRKELEAYLIEKGLMARAEIVPLNDAYGLTISGKGLEALVVSQETEKIAEAINQKRQSAGHTPLKIVTVNMIQAENERPISTTRIRSGEIDRNGHILKNLSLS